MNLFAGRIGRFICISLLFVALDVGLFALLVFIGVDSLLTPIATTAVAVIATYVLFLKFVYRVAAGVRTFGRYCTVTLLGLWLVQPVIIGIVGFFLPLTATVEGRITDIILKLITEVIIFALNYVLYRRYVFIQKTPTGPKKETYSPYNYSSKK